MYYFVELCRFLGVNLSRLIYNSCSFHYFLGDCDFETGTCTWVNTQVGDDFDWLRGSGSTPSFFTGPTADHTTGTSAGQFFCMKFLWIVIVSIGCFNYCTSRH